MSPNVLERSLVQDGLVQRHVDAEVDDPHPTRATSDIRRVHGRPYNILVRSTIGVGLEFDAIAAVILGGTSFEKGRGGIVGTVIGALAVGVLRNGLNLLGVGTEWQVASVGIVIIFAVGLDSLRKLNA